MSTETISNKKIDSRYENPVDNLVKSASNSMTPILKRLNITATDITAVSGIFSVASLYHLYNRDSFEFTIYATLAYILSVMSSEYRTNLNGNSDNSEDYEKYSYMAAIAIGIYILYTRYGITDYPILIIVLIALIFLASIHIGCKEALLSSNGSGTVKSAVGDLNADDCKKRMGYLRWFGSGSAMIFTICSVLYLNGEFDQILDNFGSIIPKRNNGTVPGSSTLFDIIDMKDISDTSISLCDGDVTDMGRVGPGNDKAGVVNINKYGKSAGVKVSQADLNFIKDLQNFGSVKLGSSSTLDSMDPYSTNAMIDKMIRD
jgi:hypothetical protein